MILNSILARFVCFQLMMNWPLILERFYEGNWYETWERYSLMFSSCSVLRDVEFRSRNNYKVGFKKCFNHRRKVLVRPNITHSHLVMWVCSHIWKTKALLPQGIYPMLTYWVKIYVVVHFAPQPFSFTQFKSFSRAIFILWLLSSNWFHLIFNRFESTIRYLQFDLWTLKIIYFSLIPILL